MKEPRQISPDAFEDAKIVSEQLKKFVNKHKKTLKPAEVAAFLIVEATEIAFDHAPPDDAEHALIHILEQAINYFKNYEIKR